MPEPQDFKVKVSLPGQGKRKGMVFYPDFDKMKNWVNNLEYEEYIKKELLKMIAKYPTKSYIQFTKDLNKHVETIQRNRSKM